MKKIISMLVVALFVLAGCSSGADSGDLVTVKYLTIGDEPADLQIVQDEMNTILEADYNLNVDFEYIGYADYSEQVQLRMSSGEPMDVVFAPSWSLDFMTHVNDGLYYPLNDIMSKDFSSTIDQAFWDGVTVDDKIYAVPTDKELGTAMFALFNEGKVPEGYDLSTVDSLGTALDLAQKYFDETGEPGNYIDKGWLGAYKYFTYDCVPALDYQVCLDVNKPEEGYKWIYNFDEYKAMAERLNNTVNSGVTATKPGDLFQWTSTDYFMHTSEGIPTSTAAWEASEGKDLTTVGITQPVVTTDSVRGSLNAIAASSEHPQEAMKLLEAINTDERLRNLFAYGVEGTHYTLDENGQVVFTDQAQSYQAQVYAQGDYDTKLLLADDPSDTLEQLDKFNESALVSPALGFTPNLTEYNAQVANILNIDDKYNASIMNFIYKGEIDDMLAPVIEEYKAVGGQDVIDEINKQYEEWKSQQ